MIMATFAGSDSPIQSGQDSAVMAAVDFSLDSESAVIWACRFADCVDARLVVVHVVHDPASSPGFYRTGRNEELVPMQDVAGQMMGEFMARIIKKNPGLARLEYAETRLIKGLPPGRIIDVAEQLDAQLIVVGSRGISGLPHLLLGSVAEHVVKLSDRPVVVVKNKDQSSKKQKKRIKKLLKMQRKHEKQLNSGNSDD